MKTVTQMQKSRRHFLRGAGVALALPWMESLPLFAAEGGKAAAQPPVRWGCVYFSNGVTTSEWWAKGRGAAMEFGKAAAPLKPIADDIVFVKGLYNHSAFVATSPHQGKMANMLSGGVVSMDPNDIRVATTMDQVLAKEIGGQTTVPSLALGIEPNELRLEDGLSMIYGSCVSWASPTMPATKEIYPARVFDALVGDGKGRQMDKSILDAVLQETRSIEPKISRGDRTKLDEYLSSVRDIEKRIDTASKQERIEGWRPTLEKPNMPRPANEIPQNVPDHMRLMLDLTVLAYQMDKTRILTLMLNNDLSQMNFKFIDGVHGALHLDLTHNGHAPALEQMYLKTNQYHVAAFTYLIEKMKAIDEGGSSLLDNSMIMLVSNLYDGDKHGADQMPAVIAGKAGGRLRTGRSLDYNDKGNDNRRACSLYLDMMDCMGVHLDRFGDADRRLKGFWQDEA
ncbi:MAG: DUF1552 domain-containing protein [Acidobacteriota bacterium]|nr:DUF1552 domain-containing protein [Acidobacteriota bacterium]